MNHPQSKVVTYCRVATDAQIKPKPMRCIIYARSACVDEADPQLDAQVQQCQKFITSKANEGWRHIKTIIEPGVSGLQLKRPGLLDVLSAIKKRTADVVVVTQADRLSRCASHLVSIRNLIEAHGGSVASATESSMGPTALGKLVRGMLDLMAEFEASTQLERIQDRVRARVGQKHRKGGARHE